jgi:hypothetical protein
MMRNVFMMINGTRFHYTRYAAGLAVESMLRAYRTRLNPEFEERHDLELLLAGSNLEKS